MSKLTFSIGFWHPFGPHSGESPESILKRKAQEIEANSWTLWSFQHRPMLDVWHQELTKANPDRVLVFCSSSGGRDPLGHGVGAAVSDCSHYRTLEQTEWQEMPKDIRVPHAFRGSKKIASAFRVKRINSPVEGVEPSAVEWLRQDGSWRQERIPTRGEYLIRPAQGEGVQMRNFGVILELEYPYLAIVRADL